MDSRERKQAARKFRECWTFRRGSEKGEDQQFWNSLLADVLRADDVAGRICYQVPVPMRGATKFLDAWIPETRTLIEHKSRGVRLDAPQSGHGCLTPYQQAKEYDNARGFDEKARWIVTCNFDEIWVYDCTAPLDPPQKIRLAELPRDWTRLEFLVNPEVKKISDRELEISFQAGRIIGRLYDALLVQYGSGSAETLAALNRFCVRLVFCLYAEDSGVFPKDCFRRLVSSTPPQFLRQTVQRLFQTLDTPIDRRDRYIEPELAAFPYTNGGLFAGAESSEIPPMTDDIKDLLVGSSDFDWSGISPTIFGSVFESTLNPETRRKGGMHYTSVANIHKVIDPLFMDGLEQRFAGIAGGGDFAALGKKQRQALLDLQSDIAALTFLDPACGSGNFLTETYLSLRRLENRIIAALQRGQGELDLGTTVKVSIRQFYGIEINDFAAEVARAALWIAEHQMLKETAELLHRDLDFLPLKQYAGIVEGNALRLDWGTCFNAEAQRSGVPQRFDYIMGNPPFVGARLMSKAQKADLEAVFGAKWKGLGNLDYVTGWFKKAADLRGRCAFVATNSICQGDAVAPLWRPLFEQGLGIDFAWRTFRWDSESNDMAHVHCVIVGFHAGGRPSPAAAARADARPPKTIFDETGAAHAAAHINAYLMAAPDVWVENRTASLHPEGKPLVFGSMPNDGGRLSGWSPEAKDALVAKYPAAAPLFRRLVGSAEHINNIPRWCLWLKGASPAQIRAVPPVLEAVAAVREARLASSRASTRKLADSPALFGEIRQPESGNYLLIPRVSSERRAYVPIGFYPADVIANDAVLILPNATLYDFGVLTSSVHMAWMRAVAGRLKSDYRYSAGIVYNNFPWPCGTPGISGESGNSGSGACAAIAATAQSILDARARYPDSSLADLYDPVTMPADLRAAHAANDAAVLAAYGWPPRLAEPEIVARLFALYASAAKGGDHV